jgi:hypothetical protein
MKQRFASMILSGSLLLASSVFAVDIYVSEYYSPGAIYKIDSQSGERTLIASDLGSPEGIAIDSKGVMYIGGGYNGVMRVDIASGARLSDVGTNICPPEGPSIDEEDNVYFNTRFFSSACGHSGVWKIPDGTALTATQIIPPFSGFGEGTAFLTKGPFAGCLIAADRSGGRIVRSCPPSFGVVEPFISDLVTPIGIAVNSAGDIFISRRRLGDILRYDSSGMFKETFISGQIRLMFMAFDEFDNLYVAEHGPPEANKGKVIMISPSGVRTDLAIGLSRPVGIAIPPVRKPIREVHVIDTISTNNIDLDATSFSKPPISIMIRPDRTIIEWQFDTFSIGQIEDLSFDVILKNPVPGEDRLVNHQLTLLYPDVNGNTVRTELPPDFVHVLSSAFSTTLVTDQTQYTANEDVLIDLAISNLSEFARTVNVVVEIEDSAGHLVEAVTTFFNLTFAAGETRRFSDLIYNTGGSFAGDYRAHVRLIEAVTEVGEAFWRFTVLPVHQATSIIAADKIAYTANEPVTLTATVTSLSPNSTFTGLNGTINVSDPLGAAIFTETRSLADLLPDARVGLKSFTHTGIHPAGTYTATLQVLSNGVLLTHASTIFQIRSSLDAGLSGTIDVHPDTLSVGATTRFDYRIQNTGNILNLPAIEAVILIVDPDTGEAVRTVRQNILLTGREIFLDSRLFDSAGLLPKAYLVVLQVVTGGVTQALASGGMTLIKSADLDSFLGYEITPKGPVKRFNPPLVLTDLFGTRTVKHISSEKLLNPADKNGEGIHNPNTHLERYKLLGQGATLRASIKAINVLGEIVIRKMKPTGLLVPTAKSLDLNGPPPDPPVTDVDHFQCYQLIKKKERPATKGMTVHLKDLLLETDFAIREPVQFCTPVAKVHNGVTTSVKHPEKHLICYSLKPVRHKLEMQLSNPFGREKKKTTKADELCVPSTIKRLPNEANDKDSDDLEDDD